MNTKATLTPFDPAEFMGQPPLAAMPPQPAKLESFRPGLGGDVTQAQEWPDYRHLRGAIHQFPDGVTIRIVQVKTRDGGVPWITSEHLHPGAFPRRYTENILEFRAKFGHLFQIE